MTLEEIVEFRGGNRPYNYCEASEEARIETKAKLRQQSYMEIRKVIFNDPATIVIWQDGTKTVVKCANEKFDPEKGLAMAIAKRALGDKGNYYNVFKRYIPDEEVIKYTFKDFMRDVEKAQIAFGLKPKETK